MKTLKWIISLLHIKIWLLLVLVLLNITGLQVLSYIDIEEITVVGMILLVASSMLLTIFLMIATSKELKTLTTYLFKAPINLYNKLANFYKTRWDERPWKE